MTAVIGILNKEGAAIAADSAVTMTRGPQEKISNSANKMVRLSDVQPIAVMIFSSADFMEIPWDLIVRWYRHRRGKLEFPTFRDHVDDFLGFLVRERFFCTDEQNKNYLAGMFEWFFQRLDVDTPLLFDEEDNPENLDAVIADYRDTFGEKAEEWRSRGICPQFGDYTVEDFKAYAGSVLYEYLARVLDSRLYPAVREFIVESFYYFLIHRNERHTGLVFTGYGKEDRYPSSLCVRVVHGFDGRLACFVRPEEDVAISDKRPFAVLPYAQTDVMQILVQGIDPGLDEHLCEQAESALMAMRNKTRYRFMKCGCPEEVLNAMDEVPYEDLMEEFKGKVHARMKKARNSKVFNCVKDLSVREMVRLAEEMVNITAVKRHINFDDEGVGGLVDLAAITRDKGFTWLNRKGWYDIIGEDGFKI